MCHYAINWCDKVRFFAFIIPEPIMLIASW